MGRPFKAHVPRPRLSRVVPTLAVAMTLFSVVLVGCTPEAAEEETPPTAAEQPPASPSSSAAPSASEDGEQEGSGETPTEGTGSGSSPDGAGPADEGGGSDGADHGTSTSGTNGTADWSEPEDPTSEGPTALPALPEVDGRIGDDIELPTDVIVSLSAISTTTLTAETPGEQSGPAVVVEVQVANQSEEPQSVASATVSLSAESGEIGIPTWAHPNDPLHGEVPAGGIAVGTYVFMLDPADERPVTVRVNYSAGEPVATFTGTTP